VQRRVSAGLLIALAMGCASTASQAATDGPATATVTVDDQTIVFAGGTCDKGAGALAVTIGSQQPLGGMKPSYFAMSIPGGSGPFSNVLVTILKNGHRYVVLNAIGEATGRSARFTGHVLRGGASVKGSFHC
jgi:hypothetical protein